MSKKSPKVAVIQRGVSHYREAFWEELFRLTRNRGIDLKLHYGVPISQFGRTVPYGTSFRRRNLFHKVAWFPVLTKVLGADFVIVEHTNKSLINFVLFILQFLGGPKLGFWGHGRNHQTDNPDSLGERIKIWMGRHSHWYFAYTEQVRSELIERGFDPARVTDVQNAVAAPEVLSTPEETAQMRRDLGLPEGAMVGFYCSQMYPLKRLDLLIEAAKLVHDTVPSFHLILAGAGLTQKVAEDADRELEFVHYVGPQFGVQKATCYALSRVVAFPGALGLGIVDAFNYGVPPVVAEYRFHGPEIIYLDDGENALLTGDNAADLAAGIVQVCQDDQLHEKLVQGCKVWSEKITINAMAEKFATGIEGALAIPVRPRALVA